MSAPRVTALINTCNYGRFVGEAIESVLAQDFPPSQLEVAVVDDGSTDDTREVVARFGDRVRYLYKPNGGQASALNLGWAQARGEIVAFLDADDVWLPGKLRRVVGEFGRYPEAAMVSHALRYRVQGSAREWDDTHFPATSGDVVGRPDALLRYGDISTSSMALRKAAAAPLFPIPEGLRIYADSYLVYLAIFLAPVAAINEHLAIYRHHDRNRASFSGNDHARGRLRWSCYKLAIEEAESWLRRSGWDLARPELAAYVERHWLVERMLRFSFEPASRREFYAYLHDFNRVYAPLWSPGYRAFRHTVALAGLLLGYRAFGGARNLYRRMAPLLRLRRRLLREEASNPAFVQGAAG